MIFFTHTISYSGWYEEQEVYERKDIDSMWWLTRKKREALKKEQDKEISRKRIEDSKKDFKEKNIKWLYSDTDITHFPKDKWEVIDDDNDGIGYNYYFDKDGYLLIDTMTPDYKIVNDKGREIDHNFLEVKQYLTNKHIVNEDIVNKEIKHKLVEKKEQSKVIIGNGVIIKKYENIFDVSKDRNALTYIEKSDRFIKDTKGTIYNDIRWSECSSIKGNGGYVIFTNPNNNFNKITGYIATENYVYEDDTICTLKVYDSDKYEDIHEKDEMIEIYENNSFNRVGAIKFSFTFDRSIKRLRFALYIDGEHIDRTCYIKDLKYGFSKVAFAEELKRKKEDEEEIENLKRLGIYVENEWSLEALDEDGNIIYEDEEDEYEDDEINKYYNNYEKELSYETYDEETKSYEDVMRDRKTGPDFDNELKEKIDIRFYGPTFIDST